MKEPASVMGTGRVRVMDGAWGTMLMQQGLAVGACPELWCLDRPDAVRDVAKRYVEAGADIIGTNSFGGTGLKLSLFGLADRAAAINEAAAALSREAAGPFTLVFGTMGPTGRLLMMGDVTREELYEAFSDQAVALERGGADAILVETMMDVEEACLAIRASREHTDLGVACTFTFHRGADGAYHTPMGVTPARAAEAALAAGAQLVGTNCGQGVDDMVPIVRAMSAALADAPGYVPLIVQANAGLPIERDGTTVYPESPAYMAARVPALIEAGASIIGGCCGTTPDHVRAIRQAVDAAQGDGE